MCALQKLYYQNSLLFSFSAAVTACEAAGEGKWKAALTATAFYPEGGGQPADRGTLGGAQVLDVHEKEGEIWHTLDAPLPVGETVEGAVDACRRIDLMQQHTGEHILSGTLHRMFGAENVGFHISADTLTMDTSCEISAEGLAEAEREANCTIWNDTPVHCWWPDPEELAGTAYRSKKALEGPVRLVNIPGADCCACCGTHLPTAGMVGSIKIIAHERYKGGTRLTVVCGARALADYADKCAQTARIGARLSAKPAAVADAVERLAAENADLKARLAAAETGWVQQLAAAVQPEQAPLVVAALSPDGVRRLALAMAERTGYPCLAAAPEEGRIRYALVWQDKQLPALNRRLTEALHGRGGGRAPLAMGSFAADEAALRACWNEINQQIQEGTPL